MLSQSNLTLKSNKTVAQEVLKGKLGNSSKRKEVLGKAGYDYQ